MSTQRLHWNTFGHSRNAPSSSRGAISQFFVTSSTSLDLVQIFLVDVDALPKSRTGCGTAKRHTHTSAPKNTPVEGGIEGQHRALFPIPLIDDDQTKVAQSMRPSSSRWEAIKVRRWWEVAARRHNTSTLPTPSIMGQPTSQLLSNSFGDFDLVNMINLSRSRVGNTIILYRLFLFILNIKSHTYISDTALLHTYTTIHTWWYSLTLGRWI